MIFPSVSTVATPLSSIFTVKLTDVTNMNWDADEGCPSVLQQEVDLTVYNGYMVGSPNFGGDNVNSATAAIVSYTPANYLSTYVYVFLISPDQVATFYTAGAPNPDLDLKFSYSTICSVWARPT